MEDAISNDRSFRGEYYSDRLETSRKQFLVIFYLYLDPLHFSNYQIGAEIGKSY